MLPLSYRILLPAVAEEYQQVLGVDALIEAYFANLNAVLEYERGAEEYRAAVVSALVGIS